MLLFLTAIVLWLPALAGWALPWAWLRQRLGGPGLGHFDGGDGVAGLAVLAALAMLFNFVVPLTNLISWVVLLSGWLLLAVRLMRVRRGRLSARIGLLWLGWIVLAAQLANIPPDNYDSGLYHLQHILWTHAAAVPLGLANLQGRFGFNSTATPLAALLQVPLWGSTINTSPNVLGALLLCLYGAEWLSALRRPGPRWTRTSLFLTIGAVMLFSVFNFMAVNSPTSDWPILVLTLLAVALTLRMFDDPATFKEAIAATTLVAMFAVTVKLSALPLFGLPIALALYARRQQWRWPGRALVGVLGAGGLGLGLPWIIRSVLLSGCLVYPVVATCFSSLPWVVPAAAVQSEAKWVISWAREPKAPLTATLHDLGWLPGWLGRLSTDSTFILSVLLIVVGVAVWAGVRGSATTKTDRAAALVIGTPLVVGLIYWIFTAPDVRFAAGYFWGLGLLAISLGYHRLASVPRRKVINLVRVASLQLCALVVLANAALLELRAFSHLHNVGMSSYSFAWPAVEQVPTLVHTTLQGEAIRVPVVTDQCWLTPLPCAPYFNETLVIERDAAGAPRQLSVPHEP